MKNGCPGLLIMLVIKEAPQCLQPSLQCCLCLSVYRECTLTGMIKHTVDIVRALAQHVNPSQTPVITADQPLYAMAKNHNPAINLFTADARQHVQDSAYVQKQN